MRILLVRLSALGDVATGLHVLSTIRERDCSARVGWLVEDRFAPLLEGHPEIDVLHVYRRKPRRELIGLIRSIRSRRYDFALDLQGNFKSGLLTRLAAARRPMGLGGAYCREGNHLFIRERIVPPPGAHKVEAYLALLDAAIGRGPRTYGRLHAQPQDHDAIVLHPGVSRFLSHKKWPAASFADLGDRLSDRLRRPVLLTAGPGERGEADAVARKMRRPSRIVEPADLVELKNVLAGARLVVGGDTGPTHIAAALGVPTIGVFGPTNMPVVSPYGPRTAAVWAGVRCSPCRLRWCPETVCMTQLGVDPVERAALELLG